MSTELSVIQSLVQSLTKTSKTGEAAMDEAVQASSGGKFSSIQEVIDDFISNVTSQTTYLTMTGKKNWLADYCGIIMDNDDTGAITGADAGSSTQVKTTHTVVDEQGVSSYNSVYPSTADTVIDGVTFSWPYLSSVDDTEKTIVCRLRDNWLPAAMKLVEETYGVSFSEGKTVNVNFESSNNGLLAWVSDSYDVYTGKGVDFSLTINMHYFSGTDLTSEDGDSGTSAGKLDRILAHELTHTMMEMNIPFFSLLPTFFTEGIAEVTHGIDDFRELDLYQVMKESSSTLKSMLDVSKTDLMGSEGYAASYMLLRYYARQCATDYPVLTAADYLPYQFHYTADKMQIFVGGSADYSGTFDLNQYADTVTIFNAAADLNAGGLDIIGTDRSETFYMPYYASSLKPGKGNDIIFGQTNNWGMNYYFGEDDGSDRIVGFDGASEIHFTQGVVDGLSYVNNILYLWSGNTTIMVKDIAKKYSNSDMKVIAIEDAQGEVQNYQLAADGIYIYDTSTGTTGAAITQMDDTAASYYSLDGTKLKLTANFMGTLDLSDYADTVTTVNASAVTADITFAASAQSTTTWLGQGADTVEYGAGSGRDVLRNFDTSKDVIRTKSGSIVTAGTWNGDVYLRYSSSDVLNIMGAVGKSITVDGSKIVVLDHDQENTVSYADDTKFYGSLAHTDTVTIAKSGTYRLWDTSKFSYIDTLDANRASGSVALAGGYGDKTIIGSSYADQLAGTSYDTTIDGGAGNDTIWCKSGRETILFGEGSGRDTVYNFDTSKDAIRTKSGSLAAVSTWNGSVFLRYADDDVLNLVGAIGKSITIDGKKIVALDRDRDNTAAYADDTKFYGSLAHTDTVTIAESGTYHLWDISKYSCIDVLDASHASGSVALAGGYGSTKLIGSSYADQLAGTAYDTTIDGGAGNDTIWCKGGKETILFGQGSGRDVVHGFDGAKDEVRTKSGSTLQKVGLYGGNVYLRFSGQGDVLELEGMAGKTFTLDGKRISVQQKNGTAALLAKEGSPMLASSADKNTLSYLTQVQAVSAPIASLQPAAASFSSAAVTLAAAK